MGTLGWIVSIVGVLGIGGTIAFAFFAPLVFAQFFKAAFAIFGSIWDTRLGMGCMVGLACLVAGELYGDYSGDARVTAKWHTANEAAARKTATADAAVASKAENLDKADTAAESKADQVTVEDRNAYVAELEKRAAGVCLADDADTARLRNLR